MKLKVFTAFSGYDSQCMALDKLKITYDLVGWSEIDKHAIKAHNAIYPQYKDRNYGDISKIDWSQVPDFDLFTYSSPCTDFSTAGKMAGGEEGSGTHSSLLWECRKAILAKKPKYLLFENVKNVVGKRFIETFEKWKKELEKYGYSNYVKVLNASNYNVAQNRERVFMISILNDKEGYTFPEYMQLTKSVKDYLEQTTIDEKYYLSKMLIERCLEKGIKKEYIANRINVVSNFTKCNHCCGRVININGISPTVMENHGDGVTIIEDLDNPFSIRKLTPREMFRLMGVEDKNIDKMLATDICRGQLFKLAGNSIVVDVLENILKNLFVNKKQYYKLF
jgi:DNA (cytosine-5)-methyltransferase 1